MAINSNATMLKDLVNPQVLSEMISSRLFLDSVFIPMVKKDTTLMDRAGSVLSIPRYTTNGIATIVAEGEDIPITKLTTEIVQVPIVKIADGSILTDEALLAGAGAPYDAVVQTLAYNINAKVDAEILKVLATIKTAMTTTLTTKLSGDGIATALSKFGQNVQGEKVIYISPEQLAQLRTSSAWINATDMGVKLMMDGAVGSIWGCQVILSDLIKPVGNVYNNFIVKKDATMIAYKREIKTEEQRKSNNSSTEIYATLHAGFHLLDETKAIKIITDETGTFSEKSKTNKNNIE
ncbi:MAG: hypothetical protein RR923_02870 [Bacilli bacterium]